MKVKIILFAIASLTFIGDAIAQIPIEVFGGQKKTTFDLLFFKYVKNNQENNSKFLFFNRNRVSIDYRQTTTTYQPIFGFTEALSFNCVSLKGLAPVVVAQISNKGIFPKAGVQYFYRKRDFTFFSWVVCETLKKPNIDLFVLTRYEPKLTKRVNLFTQLELVNAFPTFKAYNYNLFQRVRIGLKIKEWQFGSGLDFNEEGRKNFAKTNNFGVFLRHEF